MTLEESVQALHQTMQAVLMEIQNARKKDGAVFRTGAHREAGIPLALRKNGKYVLLVPSTVDQSGYVQTYDNTTLKATLACHGIEVETVVVPSPNDIRAVEIVADGPSFEEHLRALGEVQAQ